jgi:predicted aspartyl protease
MEVLDMGKTFEKVMIKNFVDIAMHSKGIIKEDAIRTVETEALVDTGAAYLCLPPGDIEKLGLVHSAVKEVTTANGKVGRRIFYGAVIIIKDREIEMQVMENAVGTPPLIGYLVLEAMDFLVDSKSQRIIPNPAHEGKWIIDLY